jgi:pilus assembly protein TadC
VAAALEAGAPAALAWSPLADDACLGGVVVICCRAAASGSPVAAELLRVASRLRLRRRAAVERAAARAGVYLVLPLGACFLPAFVLVTVVPVVAGLLPQLT